MVRSESTSESTNWRLDCTKEKCSSQDDTRSSESSPGESSDSHTSNGCMLDQKEMCKSKSESTESSCQEDSKCGCVKSYSCMNSCHCKCSTKRRCSTSDIKSMKTTDILLNSNLLKKSSLVPKSEKIEKINLANLVFNPNFKTNGGCVNVPVIRAGQNLAQKNAQRRNSTDLAHLTQQDALDLISQQFQPSSLDKLNAKIQKLSLQGSGNASSSVSPQEEAPVNVSEIIQSLGSKSQAPSQNNAARYKTELCRSYQEGGECRLVKSGQLHFSL